MRLDLYLVDSGKTSSRTRGANLIEMGRVTVNGRQVLKASFEVKEGDSVVVTENYEASLGGLKLKSAIADFRIDCKDKICVDVGASNGGFTDVLLTNGATRVYAVDVGECALPERLRTDPRVVVMDRTNARYLDASYFSPLPDLAVIDVSFISLKLVLPSVSSVISYGGTIIALIKPQFECGKKDLSKKGLLLDTKKREKIIKDIENFCRENGLVSLGTRPAPHPFENKNQEYLICLKKLSDTIA